MERIKKSANILLAEDDDDDYLLVKEGFEQARLLNRLNRVKDGEALLDYLHNSGQFADASAAPRPDLILLDLNMPRKDGREALQEIKADPELRQIPVIVLTSSKAEEDIVRSYDLGVSSYIQKPVTFERFLEILKVFNEYWFEVVKLPKDY